MSNQPLSNIMKAYFIFVLLLSFHVIAFAQKSVDDPFPKEKMEKDLALFRAIREQANSGVYKYRTKAQIDSIYKWADRQIEQANTFLDFYHILLTITDFEGSLHNDTSLPTKLYQSLKDETNGYFPLPIKMIAGKVLVNFKEGELPLGSEIISINDHDIQDIIPNFYKYYTTDGFNTSGKRIGINARFAAYFRLHYGKQEVFVVKYKPYQGHETLTKNLSSIGYKAYFKRFIKRHSSPIDNRDYKSFDLPSEIYQFKQLNASTALLTVNSFSIGGNSADPKHLAYVAFLDSCFQSIQDNPQITKLVVDVRANGGGTDPNDQITYSYLAPKKFVENTSAWVSSNKIPYWRYFDLDLFFLARPIARILYNKMLKKEFPNEKDGRFFPRKEFRQHPSRAKPLRF